MLRFSLGFFGVLLALGVAYAIYRYFEEKGGDTHGTEENDID